MYYCAFLSLFFEHRPHQSVCFTMASHSEQASSSTATAVAEAQDQESKKNVLTRKLHMLQREERAIQSLLVHLRSHGRLLELEKLRLKKLQDERQAEKEQAVSYSTGPMQSAESFFVEPTHATGEADDASSEVSLALEPPTAASSTRAHSKP